MLKSILKRKINRAVKDIVETLDIEDILEEAVEIALRDYDIEDEVLTNIESIARNAAADTLEEEFEDMVETAVENTFDIDEYMEA